MTEGRGRPLRALLIGALAWVGLRTAMLWPVALDEEATTAPAEARKTRSQPVIVAAAGGFRKPVPAKNEAASVPGFDRRPSPPRPVPHEGIPATPPSAVRPDAPVLAEGGSTPVLPLAPERAPAESRWSGSGWAIVRGQGATGVATPQLGGSQAGARVAYRLDDRGRLAMAGRIATALGNRQQEAAIAIEWRPTRLPVRLILEQRIGMANIRGGPGIGVAGGGRVALPEGLSLDGYAQGGAIARDGIELYGDGAARIGREVAAGGGAALDLGLGAWGAAQRGAERVDIGPSAAVTLPVAGQRLRLSLDWRQRVAGRARPGSGPALSLGTDF